MGFSPETYAVILGKAGTAGGLASLDDAGKVPSSQLPSYVDDVVEYATRSAFPETGETGKIYVAIDTGYSYRWSGSAYIQVGGLPKRVNVTLAANAWSNSQQTVTVTGVLADETKQLIQPVPASASASAYETAGVKAISQAANSLTFECQSTPSGDLTVYVIITEVSA